eukprot:gene19969-23743_t
MPEQDEARGNSGGSPNRFPQDSWSENKKLYSVKRTIRGFGDNMFLTYSQTLN